MNIIFLDFNGVLDKYDNIDEIGLDNLKRLKEIVDETNSKVVITSSIKNSYYYTGKYGKKLKEVINTLQNNEIDVIGITEKEDTREAEIDRYLKKHLEIEKFCIIDDDFEMRKFKNNIVKLQIQSK